MELIDPEPIEKYVLSLECPGGGFCFYQLDEPNLADTFFAVDALVVLNNGPATVPKTMAFIRRFFTQPLARGFFWGALYAAAILSLYQEEIPRKSELQNLITNYLEHKLALSSSRETTGGLELMNYAIQTMGMLGWSHLCNFREKLCNYLLCLRNQNGGFGDVSNLKDTFLAWNMLNTLGYSVDEGFSPARFIHRCENEEYGFTVSPDSSPAFLEDVFFGVCLCSLLNIRPSFPRAILRFIRGCQTVMNGFRRSHIIGITTLEYTYMAVKTVAFLEEYEF